MAFAQANVIHVDDSATGLNNGLNWTDAYTNLQTGIGQANISGKDLWVAQGTYSPGTIPGATFTLPSGLQAYGGFLGTETMLSQRPARPTGCILSGDINGTGDPDLGDSHHIVTIPAGSTNVRLDGFTIRHGYSPLNPAGGQGAGIYMPGTPGAPITGVVFDECRIRKNVAQVAGGAFYARNAGFDMKFCVIRKNAAASNLMGQGFGQGAGMFLVDTEGDVNIFNTLFDDNRCGRDGGGLFVTSNLETNPTRIRIYSCEFQENKSAHGGAVHVSTYRPVEVVNCTVAGNHAQENTFYSLTGSGGGFYVSTPVIGDNGLSIANSIVWDNTKTNAGQSEFGSSIEGDTQATVNTVSVQYSNIEIQPIPVPPNPVIPWGGPGSTNILAPPGFVSAATGDYSLAAGSPCLDAGSDPLMHFDLVDLDEDGSTGTEYAPLDLVGQPREVDDPQADTGLDGGNVFPGIDDMGCHERQ